LSHLSHITLTYLSHFYLLLLCRYETIHDRLKASNGRRAQSLSAYIEGDGGLRAILPRVSKALAFEFKITITSDTWAKAQTWRRGTASSFTRAIESAEVGPLPHNMYVLYYSPALY